MTQKITVEADDAMKVIIARLLGIARSCGYDPDSGERVAARRGDV